MYIKRGILYASLVLHVYCISMYLYYLSSTYIVHTYINQQLAVESPYKVAVKLE